MQVTAAREAASTACDVGRPPAPVDTPGDRGSPDWFPAPPRGNGAANPLSLECVTGRRGRRPRITCAGAAPIRPLIEGPGSRVSCHSGGPSPRGAGTACGGGAVIEGDERAARHPVSRGSRRPVPQSPVKVPTGRVLDVLRGRSGRRIDAAVAGGTGPERTRGNSGGLKAAAPAPTDLGTRQRDQVAEGRPGNAGIGAGSGRRSLRPHPGPSRVRVRFRPAPRKRPAGGTSRASRDDRIRTCDLLTPREAEKAPARTARTPVGARVTLPR